MSEYVGSGPEAARALLDDLAERRAGAEAAAEWRRQKASSEAEDRAAAAYFRGVEAVVAVVLGAAGFHRPARKPWRRRRTMNQVATTTRRPYKGEPYRLEDPPVPKSEIVEVLNRAGRGEEAALPRLREIFDLDPERLIWAAGGEAHLHVEREIIGRLAGPNLAIKEALSRKMNMLRAELAGPAPSPMERLLAERCAACWLDVQYRDWQHYSAEKEGLADSRSQHYDRLRERASRRYLAAMRTLALVRKIDLKLVAVQVNGLVVEAPPPSVVDRTG